ncbi:hypothetical protein ACE7GA_23080 [Roseomonas sp. CCTCC AB2023176]|uniref:hypothetical protein n=1 Tax=Roseomonas sp. CCTCC AB2023176 TaxID=3342640 RepID=UPI0035DC0C95
MNGDGFPDGAARAPLRDADGRVTGGAARDAEGRGAGVRETVVAKAAPAEAPSPAPALPLLMMGRR